MSVSTRAVALAGLGLTLSCAAWAQNAGRQAEVARLVVDVPIHTGDVPDAIGQAEFRKKKLVEAPIAGMRGSIDRTSFRLVP